MRGEIRIFLLALAVGALAFATALTRRKVRRIPKQTRNEHNRSYGPITGLIAAITLSLIIVLPVFVAFHCEGHLISGWFYSRTPPGIILGFIYIWLGLAAFFFVGYSIQAVSRVIWNSTREGKQECTKEITWTKPCTEHSYRPVRAIVGKLKPNTRTAKCRQFRCFMVYW